MPIEKLTQWIKKNIPGQKAPDLQNPGHKNPSILPGPDHKHSQNRPILPVKPAPPGHFKSSPGLPRRGFFQKTPRPSTPLHSHPKSLAANVMRVIPLGGLEEVGKNMMVVEYGQDIILIDMGFQFPSAELLGIDYIVPDVSYLQDKKHRIKGVLLTHGHLDHIGAIPFLLEKLGFPPLFGTRLTLALVKKKLEEFKLDKKTRLNVITSHDILKLGAFNVSFFRVNHSIPDCVGIVAQTPAGTIAHTGDFKFDLTPADGQPADYAKIAALSGKVTALFSESTNSLIPGHTVSEKQIGETLDEIIKTASGRVIIASFSSLINRVQQIINSAIRYKRRVYVSGRSMEDNINIAIQHGYLKVPPNVIHHLKKGGRSDQDDALILTTGSQGEEVSALARMTAGHHAHITIKKGDTVVISANPIVGNEQAIRGLINTLCKLGAKVISNQIMDVHTSGHAQQEDLKTMIGLIRPKYLIPVHGDLYMRMGHKSLGEQMGIPEKNILLLSNGDVLEIKGGQVIQTDQKVDANCIMVEGGGVSDVGHQILNERRLMAENGMITIVYKVDSRTKKLLGAPDVISRGFIYMKTSQDLLNEVTEVGKQSYLDLIEKDPKASRFDLKNYITGRVERLIRNKTDKTPLIMPLIINL